MTEATIQESERAPLILNWLGCEGLRFVQTLNDKEQMSVGTKKITEDEKSTL